MSRVSLPRNMSDRGLRLNATPPMPEYLHRHFALADHAYDPVAAPDGYIGLCVAENKLVFDLLQPKLNAHRDVPARAVGYDAMIGSVVLREALARFFDRTFLGRRFEVEQIAVLAGAGSVLESLFYVLADPGEGVLVPTPSYAGFWADLETRDGLTIWPAHRSADDGFALTDDVLDRALASSPVPVRALLYTNPDNPMGTVASREEIERVVAWARRHGLQVVIDEIYALSVYSGPEFVSAARVVEPLGNDVHLVWSFSKDFGASGLRAGVLVSDNEQVMGAVDALAYWATASGDTQHLLTTMISDDAWVGDYLTQMQSRLATSAAAATRALDQAGIPYILARAGIFLLCDLRQWLTQPTWESEASLWERIISEAGVNLTPGSACRVAEPGFMRLCFATNPVEVVAEGVRRVGEVVRSTGR